MGRPLLKVLGILLSNYFQSNAGIDFFEQVDVGFVRTHHFNVIKNNFTTINIETFVFQRIGNLQAGYRSEDFS